VRTLVEAEYAEDVLQESVAKACQVTPQDVRFPRAYLRRIALNVVRDQYRRQAARGGGNAVPIEDVFGEPALSYAADQEQALLLKQVILSMPELYRGVFLLNRFVGLSYQEIAVRLDISVKTVEWRMGRALAHCVAQLRD
jgi:RNA polymerase sigma-70 factor (ECF subfamily)